MIFVAICCIHETMHKILCINIYHPNILDATWPHVAHKFPPVLLVHRFPSLREKKTRLLVLAMARSARSKPWESPPIRRCDCDCEHRAEAPTHPPLRERRREASCRRRTRRASSAGEHSHSTGSSWLLRYSILVFVIVDLAC